MFRSVSQYRSRFSHPEKSNPRGDEPGHHREAGACLVDRASQRRGPSALRNTRTTASFTVGLPYEKKIDVAAERERLRKKLEQYEKVLINAERQLGNEAFLAKAPEKVVAGLKKQALEAATAAPGNA